MLTEANINGFLREGTAWTASCDLNLLSWAC